MSSLAARNGASGVSTDDELSRGTASFTCGAGDERNQFICDGTSVPFDRGDAPVTQRFGVSLSHREEGKAVFAIRAVRNQPSGK